MSNSPAGRPRQRGIALLMVIWIFMVLGVLALDFSKYMRDEAMAAINFSDEARNYYIALAAMNRALFDATIQKKDIVDPNADPDEEMPVDGAWHDGSFAGVPYSVRMIDEGALIPINWAWKDPTLRDLGRGILKRAVSNIIQGGDRTRGVDRRAAHDIDAIVDTIIDYEDRDHVRSLNGDERGAKNDWLDSPEELLRVPGMTAEVFYGTQGAPGLRDLISTVNRIHGGNSGSEGHIYVRNMTPAVLRLLLDIDEDSAQALAGERGSSGKDFGERVIQMATALQPGIEAVLSPGPSQLIRIEARADVSQERNRSWVGAIFDLSSSGGAGEPVVRRWLDQVWDSELPSPPPLSGDARS